MGRDSFQQPKRQSHPVSIHAPAWGATCLKFAGPRLYLFQSTRPHGARLLCTGHVLVMYVSIHAPAWGATLRTIPVQKELMFQSTRPHGARHSDNESNRHFSVSIHAPAWGATLQPFRLLARASVSIHAPAWGATVISEPYKNHALSYMILRTGKNKLQKRYRQIQ